MCPRGEGADAGAGGDGPESGGVCGAGDWGVGGVSGAELRVGVLDAAYRRSGLVAGRRCVPARDGEIGGWERPRPEGAELLGTGVVGDGEVVVQGKEEEEEEEGRKR